MDLPESETTKQTVAPIPQEPLPEDASPLAVVDQGSSEVPPIIGVTNVPAISGSGQNDAVHARPSALPPPLPSQLPVIPRLSPIPVSDSDASIWTPVPSEYWRRRADECLGARRGKFTKEHVVLLTNKIHELVCSGTSEFLLFGGERRFVVASEEGIPPNSDLWFIGDLHGDMLAFAALTDYAEVISTRNGRAPLFFFLGDLFDDCDLAHGVLSGFFELIIRCPKQVAFVVGNHDVGLTCDQQTGRFHSSVMPSDFADWLNSLSVGNEWRDLALSAIDFFRVAPRAVLLPDGTLVSHGGIPLTDRHDKIHSPEDLNAEGCLEDFVWTRAHETARRKIPNRSTRGCSFGIQDLDAFCDLTVAWNPPIRRLIRGHDHVPERWQLPAKYVRHPLLTINAMSWRQRDAFGPFERKPVIARWVRNQLPELHQIEIPAELIRELYGTGAPV